MSENADVEWLRANSHDGIEWVVAEVALARRILAHIDQLESEVSKQKALANRESRMVENLEDEVARVKSERRPTLHEIAAQMMAAMLFNPINNLATRDAIAASAYDAAEALVAEGSRRDGI